MIDESSGSRLVFLTTIGNNNYNEVTYKPLHPQESEKKGKLFPIIRLSQLIASGVNINHVLLAITHEANEKYGAELITALQERQVEHTLITIDAPKSEAEIYKIVELLVTHLHDRDELYLDITNAYRAIGYTFTTAAELGELLKDISVREVAYGAFEARHANPNGIEMAPVWDLKRVLDVSNWTSAYRLFERSADPIPLYEIVKETCALVRGDVEIERCLDDLSKHLEEVTDALMVLNIPALSAALDKLDETLEHALSTFSSPHHSTHIERGELRILGLILPQLKQTFNKLSSAVEYREVERALPSPPLELCAWLTQRGRLLSAIGLLRESLMGILYEPDSRFARLSPPPPELTESELELMINAVAYAAQQKGEEQYKISTERLNGLQHRAFSAWWNERFSEKSVIDHDARDALKELSKLLNEVSQLRNKLLHGWTKRNDRDESNSLQKRGKSPYSTTQNKLNILIERAIKLRSVT